MAQSTMTMTERMIWGKRWEYARKRVIINAKKRKVDLNKILIVPTGEPNNLDCYVAPWETVRQARKRANHEEII